MEDNLELCDHDQKVKNIHTSILSLGLAEIRKKMCDKLRKGIDRSQNILYPSGRLLSAVLATRTSDTQSYMRRLLFS
jgi:hypothetical protein